MIQKYASPTAGKVCVHFELPACLWADRIYVVGEFNEWDPKATPLQQERDGVWRAKVDLPVGKRMEFRYLIDGKWQTDYKADGFRISNHGIENSIVDTSVLYLASGREQTSTTIAGSRPALALAN